MNDPKVPKISKVNSKGELSTENEEEELHMGWQRRMSKYGITKDSSQSEQKVALLWALLASYLPTDIRSIEKFFVQHVEYTLARDRSNLTPFSAFQALALSIRDRLVERWKDTQLYFREKKCKRVAYLSMEYLLGRSLQNAIVNLGLEDNFSTAMKNLGYALEDLYEQEQDAGLGNGGLGRLAACFLDSLATGDYPAWGYGLRYKYGMFYQQIKDNCQIEFPDYWLVHGNPWEVERLDVVYPVRFYGTVNEYDLGNGKKKFFWEGGEKVLAVAYDTPIPGYETFNTLNIRLWSCRPTKEFDLNSFNRGDFYRSIEDKQNSERITSVLYPNDHTLEGKTLRLKQQYFLVSATIQDLIRRFKQMTPSKNRNFNEFPDLVAIQLNDTHPTLGIPELMRILLDEEGLSWESAWSITSRTFAYTNHTVLPEALEKWHVDLLETLLPRHMKIIYHINHIFLEKIQETWPGDVEKLRKMSIIEEGTPRMVRMANLAIISAKHVNGVAEIHSDLLKTDVFPEFNHIFPGKFLNITNGVTPRRWLHQANPQLSIVLSTWLRGSSWVTHLEHLSGLKNFAENPNLQNQWLMVKQQNKMKFAMFVEKSLKITIDVNSLFDVQVKRIHEYKRQLLNILCVIHRYLLLKKATKEERSKRFVPRTVFFGGKAAPGYFMAKLVIRLINSVAGVVNADHDTRDYLQVVFLPNYCVSLCELLVKAADISQHISTAGMEASGTSNMKFAINGCLLLGTMDGANVEIVREIGAENAFIFGTLAEDVPKMRETVRKQLFPMPVTLANVLDEIEKGTFTSASDKTVFQPIIDALNHGNDYYLVTVDWESYLKAQEDVDQTFKNKALWMKKSILSTAGSGLFSSDRTIKEYAEKIWQIKAVRRPGPVSVSVERLTSQVGISSDLLSPSLLLNTNNSNNSLGAYGPIAIEKQTPLMNKDRNSAIANHLHSQLANNNNNNNNNNKNVKTNGSDKNVSHFHDDDDEAKMHRSLVNKNATDDYF